MRLWKEATLEAFAAQGSEYILDGGIHRLDYPQPIPFRGRCAYSRYQTERRINHEEKRMSALELDVKGGVCRIDGVDYPMVGLGTYRLTGAACAEAVGAAAKIGYRIIDTATYYQNFDGMAQALKGLDRRRFYIISKVWHDMLAEDDVKKDLRLTLEQMGMDPLDVLLRSIGQIVRFRLGKRLERWMR